MARLLAGRYELGPRLGAGGMAEVVRGLDVRLQRPVAVKLVPSDRVDAATRERFRREARTSAGFSHPHAVTTYDAGEEAGWLYLVMELVEGRTLAERLAAERRLSTEDAVAITSAVLDALGAAHDAGLVHRDVKPGNILLGTDGSVKLADFGIARRFDDVSHDVTTTGMFVGTARYASPEQLAGKPATPASDLYSTGIVLYEMLAGRAPFDGDSAVAIAMAHHQQPVPDVRLLAPDVPPSVADTIARAMAKEPAARFASARAMRAALAVRTDVAPAASPVAPLPPTVVAPPGGPRTSVLPARPSRHRRQRWWWVAAAVLLLVGTGALVALARDRSPGSGDAASTTSTLLAAQPAATTVAATPPPTAAPTTPPTSPPTTTTPPTTSPPTVVVRSLGELATILATDPERFGSKARDILNELEQINGRGNDDTRRARQVLERARNWQAEGQLDPVILEILEQQLGPLAAESDGDGGRGGNGDDDGDD